MFGQRKCSASLQKISQQGAVCSYVVTAEAPAFNTTGWQSSSVPICLFMETSDGDLTGKVDVGQFTFVDAVGQNEALETQENSRKRKLSSDSADLMRSPAKRVSSQQVRPKEEFNSYGYGQTEGTSAYSPYIQQNNHNYNSMVSQYSRPNGTYQGQQQPRNFNYGFPPSSTISPPIIKAQSPQPGSWTSYSSGNLQRKSPSNLRQPYPPPTASANPTLIRTSTLQQTPSPAPTPHGNPNHNFNAYALYPHKAKLEIVGELDEMAAHWHWTEDELESRRRLVHFQRSQSGSTITTTFRPVSLDDRPPQSVCISCIYWEEKRECFVTSVDTIYLLESLVDARFTVEEKNRIRRNLEGFRPLTVSKGKPDSEEFFKVIMGFPVPKPRNIEKDVKVFRWKDLQSALKKIIGKYVSFVAHFLYCKLTLDQSASPSSTLPPGPALLTPVSSTGYATEGSSAYANDHHGAVSPRSISGSTTSTYISNIPARVISPHNQKPFALQGGPPDLRIPISHNPHDGPSHWQAGQHHMQASQQYQAHALTPTTRRNTWDTYFENSAATTGGTSDPGRSLNYANPHHAAESAATGNNNRIIRTLSSQQHSQSQQMPRS